MPDDYESTFILHHETNAAILVSDSDEDDAEKVWLPLSKINVARTGNRLNGKEVVEVEMPEWLAKEKGLI